MLANVKQQAFLKCYKRQSEVGGGNEKTGSFCQMAFPVTSVTQTGLESRSSCWSQAILARGQKSTAAHSTYPDGGKNRAKPLTERKGCKAESWEWWQKEEHQVFVCFLKELWLLLFNPHKIFILGSTLRKAVWIQKHGKHSASPNSPSDSVRHNIMSPLGGNE